MLFRTKDLEAIFAGRVTVAFRRWKKVGAKAGGQQRTQLGMVAIDSVEEIDPKTLTEADARAANYPDLASLHAMFDAQEGTCYRIRLRPGGSDPREELRNAAEITDDDRATIDERLAKLDAESPWTIATLECIRDNPAVVSTKLAAKLGRERFALKDDIRKLKALGLTESLEVGYRLSPRGKAYLDGTDS
jgi:biotin operon repressor